MVGVEDSDRTTEDPVEPEPIEVEPFEVEPFEVELADDWVLEEHAPERPVDRFRRSAAGTVVAAGLFGLRDALEGRPEREETAVVVDAPTPMPTGTVDVQLDFKHPERSRAVIRRPDRPEAPST